MARQINKEEVETNPIFSEFLQMSRSNSPSGFVRNPSKVSSRSRDSCHHRPGHVCSKPNKNGHNTIHNADASSTNNDVTTTSTKAISQMATTSVKNGSNGRANSIHMMENNLAKEDQNWIMNWKERWLKFMEDRTDYSMWFFSPENKYYLRLMLSQYIEADIFFHSRLRLHCQGLTEKSWFDFIILIFIASNCITLAMERPNIPPWSMERQILEISNSVFTVVFTIEMGLKVICL
jgi:hypothetical protein